MTNLPISAFTDSKKNGRTICPSQNAKFKGLTPIVKIAAIIGARPQFIKAAAISRAIAGHNRLTPDSSPLTPHVFITGDVMADALQFAATKASAHSDILARLELQPQGYLLATVHRAENTDDNQRLQNILSAFAALNEPVVFPAHPRTRKFLQETGYQPPENVKLIDPVGYFDVIALEKSARLLLTGSGGMQKEAYWLKVPCITLRDETEWIETVELGWNILTGADHDRIAAAVRTFKTPADHLPLYGDGKAAAHCLKALLE